MPTVVCGSQAFRLVVKALNYGTASRSDIHGIGDERQESHPIITDKGNDILNARASTKPLSLRYAYFTWKPDILQ